MNIIIDDHGISGDESTATQVARIEILLSSLSTGGEMTVGNEEIARVYPNWAKSYATSPTPAKEAIPTQESVSDAARSAVHSFCR